MADFILIILSCLILVVGILTLLATTRGWLKKTIPIDSGFLIDNRIVSELKISTGDPAKKIRLRFKNTSRYTLTGVVFDMRFHRPLTLSATKKALMVIPGKTEHGASQDNSYYLIRLSELAIVGEGFLDYYVELNTEGKHPGKYKVSVAIYTTQQTYEYKRYELFVFMS